MEMNHILVVEDDKEIREGVKIYLQSQGYEVFLAADGIEELGSHGKRGYPSGDRGYYDAENGWNPDDDEAERKI